MQGRPCCEGCQVMLHAARLKKHHTCGSETLGVGAAGGARARGLTEGEGRLVLQQRQAQVHQRRLLRQRAGARVVERQPLRACPMSGLRFLGLELSLKPKNPCNQA